MKKTSLISILLVLLVFTISCKKDDPASSSTSFSAKIEGTLFQGSVMMASHFTSGNLNTITAVGTNPADQISLDFTGSANGTYVMNSGNMGSAAIGNNSFASMFSSSPVGEIVITKYDAANKLISGTFYFNGEDIDGNVFHVTEGKFENVALTTY
jgi:hypothetical protein